MKKKFIGEEPLGTGTRKKKHVDLGKKTTARQVEKIRRGRGSRGEKEKQFRTVECTRDNKCDGSARTEEGKRRSGRGGLSQKAHKKTITSFLLKLKKKGSASDSEDHTWKV